MLFPRAEKWEDASLVSQRATRIVRCLQTATFNVVYFKRDPCSCVLTSQGVDQPWFTDAVLKQRLTTATDCGHRLTTGPDYLRLHSQQRPLWNSAR